MRPAAVVKRRRETLEERNRREEAEAAKEEIVKVVLAEMPSLDECQKKYRAGRATEVETFLLTHMPMKAAYTRQVRFRRDFAAVLVEVAGLAPKAPDA